jgi:hemoglobin
MAGETPTIFEWGGGAEAFGRWLNRFYDLVEEEGTLAPLFGGSVHEEHRTHVLAWWIEVMGGPADYSANLGGYPAMLAHHRGLAITPEQRRLFVTLLSRAADEVELPGDPEFRAAIMGLCRVGLAPRRPQLRPRRRGRGGRGARAPLGLGSRSALRGLGWSRFTGSPGHSLMIFNE